MNSANRYTPYSKKRRPNSDPKPLEPVHVYCRLRPIADGSEPTNYIKLKSADTLVITSPPDPKGTYKEVHHKFKHIFTAFSSQKEVFTHIAFPLLDDLLNGKNGLLFTYGVTGSGKTYTLTGEQNDPGIVPRSINTLFNSIENLQTPKYVIKSDKMNGFEVQTEEEAFQDRMQAVRGTTKTPRLQRKAAGSDKIVYENDGTRIVSVNENNLYAVFVSYVEIYNNCVYDLLDEITGKTLQNKILREDVNKNMYVNGVVEIEVKSAQEALDVFVSGQNKKRVASTILNADSSRSHSIFNIRVAQIEQVKMGDNGQPMIPEGNLIKIGQLSLVDLAGSERTNRTQNTGVRLKEASSINNSLMSLRTCLEILRDNQLNNGNKLIPYRDSKLTYLFKSYFEGGGTVKMIVCINPSIDDFEENLQVLKFAEMTQDVKLTKAEPKYTALKKTISRTATPARPKYATKMTPATPSAPNVTTSGSLLPDIPIYKFDPENLEMWGDSLKSIIASLKTRQSKVKMLCSDFGERKAHFRKKLMELNQNDLLNKAEIKCMKSVVNKEKQKVRSVQTKLNELEVVNTTLQTQNEELQTQIRTLHRTIGEKDLKLNRNMLERAKYKQKFAMANEQMTHELDEKLRRQRAHLNAEIQAKDTKLKLVKDIIENEIPTTEALLQNMEQFESVETNKENNGCNSTHHSRSRNPGTVSTPRPRRSRSVGDVWLEHNSIKPCPLGTVMQPKMKKRKSVTKLEKASDVTNSKQSKYCLIAQEPDTDGEMETKLYKADIVPTCGGGAQVIFNDVERLRQESPTRSDQKL